MASEAFERHALGEAIRGRIGNRRVLAALFTTYSFDPGFFELHVLPLLFARGFSKEETVRRVQLDEALHSTPVAVYFDRGAVNARRGGGSLGFHTFGIRRTTASGATKGRFHPKLLLALVDAGDGEEALVLGVMSANLTEPGHWTNVECAWFDEVVPGRLCSYQEDLVGILKALRDESRLLGAQDEALARILAFAAQVPPARQRTQDGWFQTRLFYGQDNQTFAEFLAAQLQLPADTYHLEVISPYFDDGSALRNLRKALKPQSTRVYLPLNDDGATAVEKSYFDEVRASAGAAWARFADASYLRRSSRQGEELRRTVHAKVYRLWSKSEAAAGEFVALGSTNLTRAAHSPIRTGNFEVSVVLESRTPLTRPFLVTIDAEPSDFGAESEAIDEAPNQQEPCPLVLRFFWASMSLEAYWDAAAPSPAIELESGGVRLPYGVGPLQPRVWITLAEPVAKALAEHLPRTTLLRVHVPDAEPSWIIVREEDLAQKPELLLHLTVEEILRYWSALSDAQRQALLERADLRRTQVSFGRLPALQEAQDGLFERFAGVFHAFERLREHVEQAVADKRPRDAEYRLFGAKHDSLPSLLERVTAEGASQGAEIDSVPTADATTRLAVRYATLLSARRLLQQLESSVAEFLMAYSADVQRLRTKLDAGQLRKRVVLGCGERGDEFVDWLDRWFLTSRDASGT